jgi:hypothetical protein
LDVAMLDAVKTLVPMALIGREWLAIRSVLKVSVAELACAVESCSN